MRKSADKRGKAAPEQQINTNFETSSGRGVYTSGRWGKSLSYSVPLLYPGWRFLFKLVLLVEVPGDLSDHGVGVAHKAEAVLQNKGNNKEFQIDEGKDSWLIKPKSDYIRALAADADELWHIGVGIICRFGPERPTRRWRIVSVICPKR